MDFILQTNICSQKIIKSETVTISLEEFPQVFFFFFFEWVGHFCIIKFESK